VIVQVARIASVLEVSVTAEGVETSEQLDLIQAAGYTHHQGHPLGDSRSAEGIAELLRNQHGA
jgi:EAL domain-containing protein (putative c-di-GMP-specific phosphodiesterase class I)